MTGNPLPGTLGPIIRLMTYSELIELATRMQGVPIKTRKGVAFKVGVSKGRIFFVVGAKGRPRYDSPNTTEHFLEQYNATGQLDSTVYAKDTVNANYYVSLLLAAKANPPK